MRKVTRRLAVASVVFALAVLSVGFAPKKNTQVIVDPPFGRHSLPVRVLMTRTEFGNVVRMTREISSSSLSAIRGLPATAAAAEWIIEPSAAGSRTLALSRTVLERLQTLLESLGLVRMDKTHIVIGRSQQFINESLDRLGCFPNLVRTGGIHLMGASVCNRRVIIINLTGYFFLRRSGDALTTAMESWPEPRLSKLNYRLADRNISGLAHEWAHVARVTATDGAVATDEPAWFREGFAEVMAGIARVQAFAGRMSYTDFHVVRLRKFADWGSFCNEPLRRYRRDSDFFAGCEYYLGALAVEWMIARMGGLSRVVSLFRESSRRMNFTTAFRATYGMPLDEFEERMDLYLAEIAGLPDI